MTMYTIMGCNAFRAYLPFSVSDMNHCLKGESQKDPWDGFFSS